MVGTVRDESSVGRSMEGLSSDALAEWRSSEQVENGTPSTSPPYWDIDDSDDDGGLKPSELYGKHTWKIENISKINKRELRSNAFEVGGYKWYILVYPQGCDVCNHLSLFLCVANHDKLLPGWSHFAQFTIAVVNKDPKKSKFSDTLHRFWKKEHDWGWKKFMELSKVSDGFLDGDALTIKAQVQVIREKADRPFRCLDRQYRRELVRVYLTNVEQICRRFVEERRAKLGKLIVDKAKWSSFCAFWLGMDQNVRRRMSKERKDVIFKVVVKHFFIEKEVTSTLVMDSLYSGLKALEGSKGKKGKGKLLEGEDTPASTVRVEKDMFVLVDDVLLLLERAAMEPLPPKDEKGPQNRIKDGGSGEDFYKNSIERDERRLTELGRRTVEIFVLAHIFSSKIEAAYQEDVSLKRQEELIREEEAAWQVESEQKAKRSAEKDKKSKKKQGKQKRNNRRGKEKTKDDKPLVSGQDKHENLIAQEKDLVDAQTMLEKHDELEDLSDASDSVECTIDVLHPDSEDRDTSPVNWDTDTSEAQPSEEGSGSGISIISTVQNGAYKRSSSLMDDSSSTCSTDSAPSVTINGSYRTNSSANYYRRQKSPTKGGSQPSKGSERYNGANEAYNAALLNGTCPSHKAVELNVSEGVVTSLQDRTKWPELNASKKEEVLLLQRKPSNKDHVDRGSSIKKTTIITPHSAKSPPKRVTSSPAAQPKPDLKNTVNGAMVPAKKTLSNGRQLATDKTTTANVFQPAAIVSRPDSTKASVPKLSEKVTGQQAVVFSSALTPATLPQATTPAVSVVQTTASSIPSFPRSVITDGRLGPEPSPGAQAYTPQTYRNAITGNSLSVSSAGFTSSPQQMGLVPTSVFFPQPWIKSPQRDISTSSMFESSSMNNGIPSFDLYRPMNNSVAHEVLPGRQIQCAMADEFPHLDIINDLLDDEQSIGSSVFHGLGNRQFTNMNLQSHYNSGREFTPSSQGNSMAYMNSQIDSAVPNQGQQLLNPELSLLGMRSSAMEGYAYNVSDYSNMACGVNGCGIFRPSNGH